MTQLAWPSRLFPTASRLVETNLCHPHSPPFTDCNFPQRERGG